MLFHSLVSCSLTLLCGLVPRPWMLNLHILTSGGFH